MTDIQAIRKAAEEPTRDGYVLLDPATVLELCRLAEIGRDYEDCMNHHAEVRQQR